MTVALAHANDGMLGFYSREFDPDSITALSS